MSDVPVPGSVPESAPVSNEQGNSPAPSQAEAAKAVQSGQDNGNGTWTIKSYGKEKVVSTAEMKRLASLADGANQKFEQASKVEKEAKEFKDLFKKNPLQALMKEGMSRDEAKDFLKDRASEALSLDYMSPEQRRIHDQEEELRSFKEKQAFEESERLTRAQQLQLEQEFKLLDQELASATTAVGLPDNQFLKSWVVDLVRGAESQGATVSFEEAADEVKYRLAHEVFPDLIKGLGPKGVETLFGKEFMKELRKADVADIKAAAEPFAKAQPANQAQGRPIPAPRQGESQSQAPKNKSDFFNKMRNINYK